MEKEKEKKYINKRLENLKLERLCLADLEDYLKILGATLFDDRGYLMRIIILMR